MHFIEKHRSILQLFFVCVIAVSLTTVLFAEVLWWQKNNPKSTKNVVSVGFQNDEGKKVMSGLVFGDKANELAIKDNVVPDDARPLIIERFLKKYKSPLLPYSRLIFDLSQTYGFDYYWILAIGMQESGLCKNIPEGSHNCWGYGIHKKGTLKFDNYEIALKSYAEYLKRQYFDKGLNTPELIMRKYCPYSDGSWAYGVQHFIDELESGKF